MLGQNDSEIWQCLPDTLISDFETLNLNARKDFLTNLVKHLSSEELSRLMFTIGKDQEECLKDDIENISGNNEYGELEKLHYEQLCHFIKHTIETVVEEHTLEASENAFLDNIDKNTHNEERRKDILICTLCGTENTRRKLVCEGCKKKKESKRQEQKSLMKIDEHLAEVQEIDIGTESILTEDIEPQHIILGSCEDADYDEEYSTEAGVFRAMCREGLVEE
ncbi:unnamed protein product [Mytilus coruscus]|uniref:Uncharacterized protein n=1 Tax=Mytilus coruscus TaxID=42192 RepID=A0A6J8D4C4_MYTCO|nr:unnamed protein product [Mytilus coruscus]